MHSIEARILRLKDLPTPQLNARWHEAFGKAPPQLCRELLLLALASRLIEQEGGSPAAVQQRLERLAGDLQRNSVREWRGPIGVVIDLYWTALQTALALLTHRIVGFLDRRPATEPALRDTRHG